MSSQAIRNKINNSIRRVISDVKQKAISEGKKKVTDLKDQLLTPDQIIRMLAADVNQDSCSIEGRKKMEEKALELKSKLNQIDEIAQKGLTTLNGLEEKIGSISNKAKIEMPESPTIPDPIEGIQNLTESIKPIIDILNYVIRAAPAILASQIAVPGGGSSSGLIIANTNNNVNLAKAKISEFSNLFTSLPKVLDKYIAMADIVFDNITKIKSKIQIIVDEIAKLKAFIIYMELDFEDKCNQLQSPTIPAVQTPEPPIIPPPLTLADVIAQTEELYGNMLDFLIARGDNRAIRRVYELGEQFQRIRNTTVEQRYIGGGVGGGLDESMYQNEGGTTNYDLINNP
tara:strand:- start:1162 stop:2190 length:1029 start_codon:yes stop_codon:yes gene_type:complete